jgi:putative ABC transport system ATP-binding protein
MWTWHSVSVPARPSTAPIDTPQPCPGAPLIQLIDVSKIYELGPSQVRALDQVSLDVQRGEYIAIMGPSGSGKSTLMNLIGCLDRPSSGGYLFAGHDVGRMSDDQRTLLRGHYIGFVFQSFNLLARMSATEEVELPLIYQHQRARRARARAALTQVGLGARLSSRPNQLSGGQQQRVAIARALVANPSLILADEPTGALDSQTSMEIMAILTSLVREKKITVILVTHEPVIGACADRIIRMRDGRIVEDSRRSAETETTGEISSGQGAPTIERRAEATAGARS